MPPGVIGAGSEPSASLFGPIVKPEESSEVQRRVRVVVRGLKIQRTTFRCGGGCLSRLGPIRSWQLIARYVVSPSCVVKGNPRRIPNPILNTFEICPPTLSALLWLLQRTEQVIYRTVIFHQEIAHRFHRIILRPDRSKGQDLRAANHRQ